MEVLRDYTNNLNALRISEETGKSTLLIKAHFVSHVAIVVNLIVYVIDKWREIDDRFVAIKSLAVLMVVFGNSGTLTIFFHDFSSMVTATLKNMYFHIPYKISPERVKIFADFESLTNTISKLWHRLLAGFLGLLVVSPLTNVAVKAFMFSGEFQTLIKDVAAEPYPLYYPESLTKIYHDKYLMDTLWYIFAYIVDAIFTWYTFYICIIAQVLPMCAILNVGAEFKLMKLSLLEMDDFCGRTVQTNEPDADNVSTEVALKRFLKYFVQHHQNTYRKFDTITNGIKWIALTICTTAIAYCCFSMYTIAQTDVVLKKINEAVFLVTWMNSLFNFCYVGERLNTEVANFRNALYQSAWLDKPQWFKRSLLIIMARTDRPMDIKPFGFYGFDFNTFAKAMNAVYCYYNVLCNLKSLQE